MTDTSCSGEIRVTLSYAQKLCTAGLIRLMETALYQRKQLRTVVTKIAVTSDPVLSRVVDGRSYVCDIAFKPVGIWQI